MLGHFDADGHGARPSVNEEVTDALQLGGRVGRLVGPCVRRIHARARTQCTPSNDGNLGYPLAAM